MGLSKYKLGDLIGLGDARNEDLRFGDNDVRGISTGKKFIDTKANLDGVNLSSYKVVGKNQFAYVADTSRRGDKIALAFNKSDNIIVSSIYTVFFVRKTELLLSDYLFMYFNRPEFDRYARFNSWGSARETFDWSDMCDIDIELPPLSIQQKYVDIYNAMLANQQSYERGLEDLKLTIDATVEGYKNKHLRTITLEQLIVECDLKNSSNEFNTVYGVNKDKRFMPTVTSGEDLSKYKIVQKNCFACNLMHVGRDVVIPLALNNTNESFIISPAYLVFEINTKEIVPEFFMIWFSREETDRRAWFMCDSNIRGGMDKKSFFDMNIPVPPIKEQHALTELFEALSIRKEINDKLKSQIKDICPILIKGSIEEARREV